MYIKTTYTQYVWPHEVTDDKKLEATKEKNTILFSLDECEFIKEIRTCINAKEHIKDIIEKTKNLSIDNKWDTYELELDAIEAFKTILAYSNDTKWRKYIASKWLKYKTNEEYSEEFGTIGLWSVIAAEKLFKGLQPEIDKLTWPAKLKRIKQFVQGPKKLELKENKENLEYWLWHVYHNRNIDINAFLNKKNNEMPQLDEEQNTLNRALHLAPAITTTELFEKYIQLFSRYGSNMYSGITTNLLDYIWADQKIEPAKKIAIFIGFMASAMDAEISDIISSKTYKALKRDISMCSDIVEQVIDTMCDEDSSSIIFKLNKYDDPEKMSDIKKRNIIGQLLFKGMIDDIKKSKEVETIKSLYDISDYKVCIKLHKMKSLTDITLESKDTYPLPSIE